MTTNTSPATCELCQARPANLLWRDDRLRIIAVADPDIPAYLRIVWNAHVRELTDLDPADARHLLDVMMTVERALRAALAPRKVNLASLGNLVPHLHWHVIPRFENDAHFPQPIWGARQRDPDPALLARQRAALPALGVALANALGPGAQ
jgi:diadenosine tetraphosphate (Ap4A) HIT family hydrolase